MSTSKLLVFLLIICTKAVPFLWHKSFWKSVTNVCLAYCAISIETKCIWGNCVDPIRKQCTPFFQQIQAKPLHILKMGRSHTIYEIVGTNLVSKGLDIYDSSFDKKFVTKTIHRLPNIEGINRPLCITKNGNQYNVISERVISLEKRKLSALINENKEIIKNVFDALDKWVEANGMRVWDWGWGPLGHNIGLTYKGEPTFFDLDDVYFKKVEDFDEEKVNDARKKLQIFTKSRRWKNFINEVAKDIGLPPFHKSVELFSIKLQAREDSFPMKLFVSIVQLFVFILLFFRMRA